MRLGGAGCGVRHQGPFAIAEPRRSDAVSLRSARAALDAAQKTRGKVGVSGEADRGVLATSRKIAGDRRRKVMKVMPIWFRRVRLAYVVSLESKTKSGGSSPA